MKTKKKAPEFEIERVLNMCTSHITRKDSELLTAAAEAKRNDNMTDDLLVYDYPEGFFIYCSAEEEYADNDARTAAFRGYSVDLINLLRLTHKLGCKFLNLDRDGPRHDELPQHDW